MEFGLRKGHSSCTSCKCPPGAGPWAGVGRSSQAGVCFSAPVGKVNSRSRHSFTVEALTEGCTLA